MLNLTKLTLTASVFAVATTSTAFAQDTAEPMTKAPAVVDIFTAADVDADGALDRDEFISFVVMKSDAGDADYSAVKISGEYDNHFNTKDYNADGLLTAEEVKAPVEKPAETPEMDDATSPELEPG